MISLPLKTDGFAFSKQTNKLTIKPKPIKGGKFFILPRTFYYRFQAGQLSFLFTSKFYYKSFMSHLLSLLEAQRTVYLLKLRLRGLGYRIRRYGSFLYRFYFTRTNYIYFHLPQQELMVKRRKKRIFLLSTNYYLVRLVFTNLMLLHKVGPYNRRGFSYPRQIVFLKPIRKIV